MRPGNPARPREGNAMAGLTRRSLINRSVGFVAAGALARPYIANAQAKTATVWWTQGFVQDEDISFKKTIAEYETASGNKIDYSIIPFAPMRQKIVSAVTSGVVPDVFQNNPAEIVALYAWEDKLLDVSDIVETQKNLYTETAMKTAFCYNNVTKKRSFYGVPYTQSVLMNHVWRPLVEKAGYQIDDIPKTWNAYYDFFKEAQKKLRSQGMRKVYGIGLTMSTTGNDTNNQFNYFMNAYGGANLVTPDGKLNAKDPQVIEAAIKALEYPAQLYKEGVIPPSAINWNDSDNNNAFHSKVIVMDLDGTISTEVAIMKSHPKDYDDIETMGLALDNNGKKIISQANNACGLIPKGAKNVEVARDLLKYLIQPKVLNEWLKAGLGRNMPPMVSIVEGDPWWFEDPHRKAYVTSGLLGPTMPDAFAYNPANAAVRNEHTWGVAKTDIIMGGMTPKAATEKALKRIEEIFAKYPIAAG
jgi:multiple sugar transport system substrate-binding protein